MSMSYGPPTPPSMLSSPPPSSYTTHGSIGAVIGVLAVVLVLCIGAILIGRLCSGRGITGRSTHYDMESWVENKCSSCVDGRIAISRPPPSPPPPPLRPPMTTEDGGGEGTSSGVHAKIEEPPSSSNVGS